MKRLFLVTILVIGLSFITIETNAAIEGIPGKYTNDPILAQQKGWLYVKDGEVQPKIYTEHIKNHGMSKNEARHSAIEEARKNVLYKISTYIEATSEDRCISKEKECTISSKIYTSTAAFIQVKIIWENFNPKTKNYEAEVELIVDQMRVVDIMVGKRQRNARKLEDLSEEVNRLNSKFDKFDKTFDKLDKTVKKLAKRDPEKICTTTIIKKDNGKRSENKVKNLTKKVDMGGGITMQKVIH